MDKTKRKSKKLLAPILRVYVSECCFVCTDTEEVVGQIRQKFPDLEVQIIDINKTEAEIPDSVFSVPTYILNNSTISLGNPSAELIERLEKLVAKK